MTKARKSRILTDYSNANSLGSRMRRRRVRWLLPLIERAFEERGRVRILDVGGTPHYWTILDNEYLDLRNVSITLLNLPGFNAKDLDGRFNLMEGDACDLHQVADQSFDIAHSNSVIEHVGDWQRMKCFAGEVRRVARWHFIQTPNFWFPIEPHCMTPIFHWLPRPTRVWLLSQFSLGHWARAKNVDAAVRAVDSARLLNRSMFRALFPTSDLRSERILGLRKSHIAISSVAEQRHFS